MSATPTATTEVTRSGRSILVVDDEPHVREFVRMVLAQSGYEVVVSASADEALDLYQADPTRIDLVLSDVLMPGRTGLELAVALRELTPDLPVLLMSGFTGDRVRPVALPADIEVLEKPFKLDHLLAAVSAAVNR